MNRIRDAIAWVVFPALFLLGAFCVVVTEGFGALFERVDAEEEDV